jgi:hypothetical protein
MRLLVGSLSRADRDRGVVAAPASPVTGGSPGTVPASEGSVTAGGGAMGHVPFLPKILPTQEDKLQGEPIPSRRWGGNSVWATFDVGERRYIPNVLLRGSCTVCCACAITEILFPRLACFRTSSLCFRVRTTVRGSCVFERRRSLFGGSLFGGSLSEVG